MSIEAMKLALEALESENPDIQLRAAISLRQAIKQAEKQEPVAWRWKERINGDFDSWVISVSEPPPYAIEKQPLYITPTPRQPLTDEEIALIAAACGGLASDFVVDVARAIEAAHGIKGEA